MGSPIDEAPRRGGKISKPAALRDGHDVGVFDCGRDAITNWLRNRAKRAEGDNARTYVVCRGSKKVIGFYALTVGVVEHNKAPGHLRRNAPDPISVIILARFGVDRDEQGQGIGADLLSHAMRRALQAAKIIGARALLVHAVDGAAAQYYRDHNFRPLDDKGETFYLSMKEMRDAL